ncbi:MAG: ribonuclease HI [Ruminococcus sp.]|nr:ribonuclease HI [Ruminococcus sp.]
MKEVIMYTDGACSGNPGPGGYGTILKYGNHTKELSGGEESTTNNRMELSAVIAGLSALKEPCKVLVYSDSKYVVDAISLGWAESWKARGWKKSNKEPALNVDLWEKLLALINIHDVTFYWVKGHAGQPENERCDALAVAESKNFATHNLL